MEDEAHPEAPGAGGHRLEVQEVQADGPCRRDDEEGPGGRLRAVQGGRGEEVPGELREREEAYRELGREPEGKDGERLVPGDDEHAAFDSEVQPVGVKREPSPLRL